jgi:hypothetical protein
MNRELGRLWRRHFECLDQVVYGYLRAEIDRRAGRDPGPAAPTFGDLYAARYALSKARYHPNELLVSRVRDEVFTWSDPSSDFYAGHLESDLQRERAEVDAQWD